MAEHDVDDERDDSNTPDHSSSAPPPARQDESGLRLTLKVTRQDAADQPNSRRVQRLEVTVPASATVADALLAAQARAETEGAGAFAFEADCCEGLCGACTVQVNGRAVLACQVRARAAAGKKAELKIAPLSGLPLVRDLVVHRDPMRAAEARLLAFVAADAAHPDGVPALGEAQRQGIAALDACHQCGACLDACPRYDEYEAFVGPAALAQLDLANRRPGGELARDERLNAATRPGGIADCGGALNCVEVCPARLPLATSLQTTAREAGWLALRQWLLG
jgi:succinate dehydrogenase / fumarate reductase iron-sulfur subunit